MYGLETNPNKIRKIVDERSGGLCELCGSSYGVEQNHIVGGRGKRTIHQNQYSVMAKCWDCHYGKYGYHGSHGRPLQVDLRIKLQEKYRELGMNEEEIRIEMGGWLYTEDDKKEKVI